MSKNGVSYKADLPAHQVLELLENLVESLKKGSVCVQVDKEHVVMGLSKTTPMGVEMSASQKKGKKRLSLELSWSEPKRDTEQAPSLMIASQAPPMEPPKPAPAPAAQPPAPAPVTAPAAKKAATPKKAAAPKKATVAKKAAPPKKAAPKAGKTATRKKAATAKGK